MTTEIEKMYINAGIEKQTSYYCSFEYGAACPYDNVTCPECPYYKEEDEPQYPDFTAEKQLELIKLIANRKGYPDYEYFGNLFDDYIQLLDFNEALANLINTLWQDLTEQEKEEIRRILE